MCLPARYKSLWCFILCISASRECRMGMSLKNQSPAGLCITMLMVSVSPRTLDQTTDVKKGKVLHLSRVSSKLQNIQAHEKIAYLNVWIWRHVQHTLCYHYHVGHNSQQMNVVRAHIYPTNPSIKLYSNISIQASIIYLKRATDTVEHTQQSAYMQIMDTKCSFPQWLSCG